MKKIPHYYKGYQKSSEEIVRKPPGTPPSGGPSVGDKAPPPPNLYTGHGFTFKLYEDWQDKTVYTITGPVTDEMQHNITIMVEHELEVDSLQEFAEWNIQTLESELKSCRILKQEEITLNNGTPAVRAIYKWYPTEELRIYQEMILVLVEKTGYKITATFSKKTRKTIGPQVERMMLSFEPKPMKKADKDIE